MPETVNSILPTDRKRTADDGDVENPPRLKVAKTRKCNTMIVFDGIHHPAIRTGGSCNSDSENGDSCRYYTRTLRLAPKPDEFASEEDWRRLVCFFEAVAKCTQTPSESMQLVVGCIESGNVFQSYAETVADEAHPDHAALQERAKAIDESEHIISGLGMFLDRGASHSSHAAAGGDDDETEATEDDVLITISIETGDD